MSNATISRTLEPTSNGKTGGIRGPGIESRGNGADIPVDAGARTKEVGAGASGPAEMGGGPNGVGTARAQRRPRWPVLVVVATLAAVSLFFGVRWYQFNAVHVATDDAQVGGDVYAVSAKVGGYLTDVFPATNQLVHRGDLLARIDAREYQSALNQAEANLESLRETANASGHQVSVMRQTAGAGVSQAAAAETAATAGIEAARTKVETARAGVMAAQAALSTAAAAAESARHGVSAADAQVQSAQSQLQSVQAALVAAESNRAKAAADEQRYQTLFQQGAVSAQQHESFQNALVTADAQVQQARRAVDEANARIRQARAAAEGARSGATQAQSGMQQARVAILQAQDQVAQDQAAVTQAQAQANQAHAVLQSAQSAPAQIAVTSSNEAANMAKIRQAEAAMAQARLQLSYTEVRAPADGYISQKSVEPGQLLQPGQPLMSVVPLNTTYVDANFKETQLAHIRPGELAEIRVDAYPGRVFRGRVKSISSATGAMFSLLPPENATGNFVKVVQRVPVRITLDQTSDPNHVLRLGMSADVTITTGSEVSR